MPITRNCYHRLKTLRSINKVMRTSATIASSTTKIKAEVVNILFDGSLFPFGGSLCEAGDITDVDDGSVVGTDLGVLVDIGVEVGFITFGVGLGWGIGVG